MSEDQTISTHIYIVKEGKAMQFILKPDRAFICIETENKSAERFEITISVREFLNIAETIKCASG